MVRIPYLTAMRRNRIVCEYAYGILILLKYSVALFVLATRRNLLGNLLIDWLAVNYSFQSIKYGQNCFKTVHFYDLQIKNIKTFYKSTTG